MAFIASTAAFWTLSGTSLGKGCWRLASRMDYQWRRGCGISRIVQTTVFKEFRTKAHRIARVLLALQNSFQVAKR